MNKNTFASTPPMGWNSYDYYDTTVNEAEIKANADYIAKHLKQYGWEYIVVDIEWYAKHAGTQRDRYQYIPFDDVEMDEYSRLLPDEERFPSSANGLGFRPLADYIHNLGLKFGIHIMRGIPRIAAHKHTPILGSTHTANEIADPSSICFWNPDMYGVIPAHEAAQTYYDSLFTLYASWGVDFVKCDDICRMDMPSAKEEIQMLHRAIMNCGRPIVLSLSPGPAKIEEAWLYETYANMWRITDDFWDDWKLIRAMFDRCELWQKHVSPGCYPDCDMLPLGALGKGFGEERLTRLNYDEQKSMMTLWCMFRSPLMLGCELTKLDEHTLSLITNKDLLRLLAHTKHVQQLMKDDDHAIWYSEDTEDSSFYLAVFNFKDNDSMIPVTPSMLDMDTFHSVTFTDLWTHKTVNIIEHTLSPNINAHGVLLLKGMLPTK